MPQAENHGLDDEGARELGGEAEDLCQVAGGAV